MNYIEGNVCLIEDVKNYYAISGSSPYKKYLLNSKWMIISIMEND